MTILATLVALVSFSDVSRTLRGISEERVPAIMSLSQLAQNTTAILAAAPRVLFAETPEGLAERAQWVSETEASLGQTVRLIETHADLAGGLDEISFATGRLGAQIQILISAVDHSLAIRARGEALREKAIKLERGYRFLLPRVSRPDAGMLGLLKEIDNALALLSRSQRATRDAELEALRARIDGHLALARAAFAGIDQSAPKAYLARFLDDLELLAQAPGNLIELRGRYLWTQRIVNTRLSDVHGLTEDLHDRVNALLAEAKDRIAGDRNRTESENRETLVLMLIASAATVVAAILIAWLYVGRGVLDRVAALHASMQSIAAGDLAAPVPTSGHDEVAEMGHTVEVFRDAVANVTNANRRATDARRQLMDAIESIDEGFALFSPDDELILTNQEFLESLPHAGKARDRRWGLGELIGRSLADGHITGGSEGLWSAPEKWRDTEEPFEIQLADNHWRVVNARRTGDDGTVVVLTDVTILREREEEAKRTSELLAATFDAVGQGLVVFDRAYRLQGANARYQQLFQLPDSLVQPGSKLGDIHDAMDANGIVMSDDRGVWMKLLEKGQNTTVDEARRPDGVIIDVRRDPMPDGGFVATYTDVTVDRERMERIRYLATHDNLTALPNQFALRNDVEALDRNGQKAGFALVNLFGFREINETFGRVVGDVVLRNVATRLRGFCGPDESAYRVGADDFVLLHRGDARKSSLRARMTRMIETLNQRIVVNEMEIDVTPYAGISRFPKDGETSEDLLQAALMSVTRARARGAAGIRFYGEEMGQEVERRRFLRNELAKALRGDELMAFYQPKIDLVSNGIAGVEALARWRHRFEGMISPGEFIPVAEASGYVLELGRLILRAACQDASDWNGEGMGPIRVAVNVSPIQLLGQDFGALVRETLNDTGLPPHLLELEITEGVVMQEDQNLMGRLNDIRDLGVQITVDDFGTGYSSLSYFKRLPVTGIKIDQTFVKQLHRDPDDAVLTRAIIGLAQDFELETVAEGVEHESHMEFLRKEGCTYAQGYLIAKPMSAEDMKRMLRGGREFRAAANAADNVERIGV